MRRNQSLILVLALLVLPALAQETGWQLAETVSVAQRMTEFTMDYPEGWFVETADGSVVISELEADRAQAFGERFVVEGYVIEIPRMRGSDLLDLGIVTNETSLEEVLASLAATQGFDLNGDLQETTLLTSPALQLRTTDILGNHLLAIVRFEGLAFTQITLLAPSAEALDAFLPTWEALLASLYIERGQVILENYTLNYECRGTGSPAVILESSRFMSSTYWSQVMDMVAETTQVCSITRYKWTGITAQQQTDDLHQALELLEIQPPYVLVGHHYGGFVVRLFADQHPDEVEAMVLIDSDQEAMADRLGEVVSPLYRNRVTRDPDWHTSAEQVAQTASLEDMPLIVLTIEFNWFPTGDPFMDEIETLFQPIWINEMQPELAALSTQGRQIVVEGSNSMTIIDDPITAASILEMVELVRATTSQ